MRGSTFRVILLGLAGIIFPSIGMAAFHRPPVQPVRAAIRPIKASPSHWKAQVGTLKPYAKAGRVQASRTVGNHVVKYSPSKYTIEGLLAKRALNPARFDMTHPNLGRLLARDERLRAAGNAGPFNGLLAPSAHHNYLRWRWSLNPERFEHYHPILGVIIAEDNRLQNLLPPSPPFYPPTDTPGEPGGSPGGIEEGGGPGPGPPPSGEGGGTPAVPEPASIVLIALGASFLGIRHARRAWRNPSRTSTPA